MAWRTTLSVPLFSAVLTITVPATAQDQASPAEPQDRGRQQSMQPPESGAQREADAPHTQQGFARASRVLEMGVRNAQGQELGDISEIVVDPVTAQVKYLVLTTGETLGLGGTLHAVPWQAFSPGGQADTLVLNISREMLTKTVGFDDDHWPDVGNYAFAGVDPATPNDESQRPAGQRGQDSTRPSAGSSTRAGANANTDADDPDAAADARQQPLIGPQGREVGRLAPDRLRHESLEHGTVIIPLDRENMWSHKASYLIGLTVRGEEDQELGTIDDLVIQSGRGRLIYAVISYGGTLGVGDKRAVVPWSAVELDKAEQVASIDADRQTLDQLAFEGEDLPDMSDQRWVSRTHRAFGQEPGAEVFGYSIQADQDRPQPRTQSRPPAGEPQTPNADEAERGDPPPAQEPASPSTGDMQGQ